MMSAIFRNALYPAWHWAKQDGVNRAVKELTQGQWFTTSQLYNLQQRKLARLLSFASRNVPYYKTLLHEVGISDDRAVSAADFQQIPSLTKSVIRREHDRLVSENLAGNGLLPNSTSGSTGEALRFFTDFRSMPCRKAAELRSDMYTGWRFGDPVVRLWGAPVDEKLATSLRGRLHGWITGSRLLSSYELSDSRMDEYIKTIQDFKPVLFVAYPGPLEEFAIHCRERGVKFPSVRGIVSSAETLWPHQRETIENAFGVRVFDRYGSREFGQIGSECEAHDGLHISSDRLLVEVVDDDNQRCASGQVGRILITDLDNFGMPFIRYDIGDRATWGSSSECSCGRNLPLLKQIVGRTLEVVSTPAGNRIGGTFWTLLLRSRPGIRQFQVIQEELEGVQIRFVADTTFDSGCLEYFRSKIIEKGGDGFLVEFAQVDRIDLTESGKNKLIVSRCSIASD